MLWENYGKENTERTIDQALNRARELNITNLVVASRTGNSAILCLNQGINVVCITHHVGYLAPGISEMLHDNRLKLEESNAKILTTTHLLAGVDRGVRNKHQGVYPAELIADSLRMLGQGVKVCVEISVMALDAGLIPYGVEVLTLAGSNFGLDTAAIIEPSHSNKFLHTKVKEIICRPRKFT